MSQISFRALYTAVNEDLSVDQSYSLMFSSTLCCQDCTLHTGGVCSRCRYQLFPLQNHPPSCSPHSWVLLIEADCSPHRCLVGSGRSLNVLWHPRYRSCFHSLICSKPHQPGCRDWASGGGGGVMSRPYSLTRETGFARTQHCQSIEYSECVSWPE